MQRRPVDDQLREMFDPSKAPKFDGLAFIAGAISAGVYVRDFDKSGVYCDWAAAHPALASRLPTARTARGYHVYARLPRNHPPVYRKMDDGELILIRR